MSHRVVVRPLAEGDLAQAVERYENERAGLGARLLDEVNRTFSRVQERPFQFPEVWRGVRRALLHTFRYAVYFRASDKVVTVIAVLHQRRNPKAWRGRAH
jgi:plasmid stabilization system protein ParE